MKAPVAAANTNSVFTSGSRFAACAATLCGIHCALTPVLVVISPALALSEGVERWAFAFTVALGTVLLVLGPARRHLGVIGLFAIGAVAWAASLAGWLEPLPEPLTSAVGSLILAGGLVWSSRVCHDGACEVCAEDEEAAFDG